MTIETELKFLVGIYTEFDPEKGCYVGGVSEEERVRLERSFNQLLLKWLLKNGPEKEQVEENYTKLAPLFEMKTNGLLEPEVLWIENVLSCGINDGVCFKTLSLSHQKLIAPENFKNIKFNDIVTRDDLKKWLENFKKQATNYTERSFYESLLSLLNESTEFYDEVGQIKPKGVRVLLSFLPMVLVSIGTVAFVEELFAAYALYFILLKGGQFISRSSSSELQSFGHALQKISTVTATTTTTLLVRLIEMIFSASLQCYVATLQVGSIVLSPLVSSKLPELFTQESLEQALIKASESRHIGMYFENYKLKLIASPIESRLGLLGQQYFLGYRVGKTKFQTLEYFLVNMRTLDMNSDPIETKLEGVQDLLNKIKKNTVVYSAGGETALAINKAQGFLQFLKDNPCALQNNEAEPVVKGDLTKCEVVQPYF
ncbi:hypothetical protein [Legionella drancourtii]|uniref:Uncharacterized protein n=1 Tax=Legionella drancourtii LLAP12 TaxID=658187 RepID=G9EMK4_9GAMM|nr:hypothetical protein [Legionella drancourtii]EHL31540.1 hypothetical protein LDG_6472 [Legionella drancourtii LLAP12]